MMIKLIVGIGNIGLRYTDTRHNYGHKYIQCLAKQHKINLKSNDLLFGFIGTLKIFDCVVQLLIPKTYMNNSGLSVYKCVNFFKLSAREILVVHDELDLNPGYIKIKLGKKMNESHRGIQNIIDRLNKCDFYRLRIGIGRPKNKTEIVNFVLSLPTYHEKNKIDYIIHKSILYTKDMIYNNFTKVMNNLHSRAI